MDIQRSEHEIDIERDAHGWSATCACGWRKFSITRGVIDVQAKRHMAELIPDSGISKGSR